MGEGSKISWTDHTFNPWWGCVKVSPACDHCYAESFSARVGEKVWGTDAPRRFFGDKHWNEPLKWNQKALQTFGRPARVFCASMADVFEVNPLLPEARERLWQLIGNTPYLRWNLLTKRHDQIRKHRSDWSVFDNVHIGVTVENQTYDFRITEDVEWISAEPLLGPLMLQGNNLKLAWMIVGGESGAGAREMKLDWVLALMDECRAVGVAVHFKQTGDVLARKLGLKDKSGKDPSEWPEELQVQEFPA